MDDDMKGVVVQGVVGTAMAAEWGLWMQRWRLSGRVVDAQLVVGAEVVDAVIVGAGALMMAEWGVLDAAMVVERGGGGGGGCRAGG